MLQHIPGHMGKGSVGHGDLVHVLECGCLYEQRSAVRREPEMGPG